MKIKTHQLEFSSIFFDTIFGLIIFFNIDSFLKINDPAHFVFYLLGVIIVAHWWLIFKSVDDYFGREATQSASDLLFGMIYLVLLAYLVNFAEEFNLLGAIISLILLFLVDFTWSFAWYYFGTWHTENKKKIAFMEAELVKSMKTSIVGFTVFLSVLVMHTILPTTWIVLIFGLSYLLYIVLTFRAKIVDFEAF